MEFENLGDLERFSLALDKIDVKKLLEKLSKRKIGRNDYPNEVILRLVIAIKIFGHKSVESFTKELSRNIQLRKACGLNDYDCLYGVCRFLQKAYKLSGVA